MSGRRELFERWAASYEQAVRDQEEFPFAGYDRVLDTVVERSECRPGMAVLDLGTGTGNLARRFVACGCRVLATDFAEAMLEQTRHKLPGIETQTLDLLAPSWPELAGRRFDRIVAAYVLHEFPLERACALLRRLADDHLVHGGRLVFGDIAFDSVLTRAAAHAYWQDRWDDEEHYWAADEARPALRAVGLIAGYTQVSHCGGVFALRERAQRPFHDPGDYADAAHDLRTPPEELCRLVASGYSFVLLAVAKHPRAEPALLMSLLPAQVVSWGEQELAYALAQHPALPSEGLERLAQRLAPLLNRGRDQVYGRRAGVALCNNPNTPFAALRSMLAHPRVLTNFRCLLAREATRRDVLELLRDDRSSTVRAHTERRLEWLG